MRLKRYNNFLNESTEKEINRILDKISTHGLDSLTKDEKYKLDNFNGKYDAEKSDDFSFDEKGNILINGIPYSNYELDKRKKDDKPEEIKPKRIVKSNYEEIKSNYKDYEILNNDSHDIVVVKVSGAYRYYYIYFKSIDVKEKFAVIKMVYNMNSKRQYPFRVYDNYNNEFEFNKIDVYLEPIGLNFGDFNRAWYYIEEHYINAGYL